MESESSPNSNETTTNGVTAHAASIKQGSTLLLGPAMVAVSCPNGKKTFERALIDSGSEITCVAESLVQRLKLRCTQLTILLSGIGYQRTYRGTRGTMRRGAQ